MWTSKLFFVLVLVTYLELSCAKSVSSNNINSRIVDGMNATEGEFPYYTQLYITSVERPFFGRPYEVLAACGGSLIGIRHVVTAAHCLQDARTVLAIFGFYYANDTTDQQQIYAMSYYIHAGFNLRQLKYDIGLLKLYKDVILSDYIQPIKLYCGDGYPEPKTELLIAGHGVTNDTAKNLPDRLEYATVNSISVEDCSMYFKDITEAMICTLGAKGQATCFGDSGAALTKVVNATPIQIGIVSFGANGCGHGYPDVYTYVAKYISWIKERTGNDTVMCA